VQAHADAGGDAGRADDAALVDPGRVRADVEVGKLGAQLGDVAPVGGGGQAVEQAQPGQQKGAGADRGDQRDLERRLQPELAPGDAGGSSLGRRVE
jgi:hypothetical protein